MALALLTGCAGASATRVGRDSFAIECKRSRSNCYEKAAEVCPNGFDVMDGDSHSSAVIVKGTYSSSVVPVYRGELLVRCQGVVAGQ